MTYELSASLSKVITRSREEANRLGLSVIDIYSLALGLLSDPDGRACRLLVAQGIEPSDLRKRIDEQAQNHSNLSQNVSTTFGPSSSHYVFSPEGQRLLRLTMLEARQAGVKTADEEHLLLALLRDKSSEPRKIMYEMGLTYDKIASCLNLKQTTRDSFGLMDEDSGEDYPSGRGTAATQKKETDKTSETPIIDNFGTDLTRLATEGALDPIIGREQEIQRIAQILTRRKKNNPILIGQPGVGKSAVVEGLAQLIAQRKVPRMLMGKRIVALDMAAIVAGTQYRGQFEERLRRLIQELRDHREIVLFIDEIHTIIGAGGAAGSLDAANILKPALARGEVQCIGATTTDEYRKSIEKDGALERRFQKIQLEPTTTEETLQILRNIRSRYEEHHNVRYTNEALQACVRLTEKYISERSLPDKAIDALDEAGSRVHLTCLKVPADIEEMENRMADMRERKMQAAKVENYQLATELRDEIAKLSEQLDRRNAEWLATQREHLQTVDAEQIADVVSQMSGVPVQRLAEDESMRLRGMNDALRSKVVAQDAAIDKLVRAITRNRLGLKGGDRPVGTFLFVGPTGVGKTYLVKCLAEWMFGRKDALIRIDMSEYGEKYSTSRLVGAPPGYVGYEEGGQLTEKVRRHPYSVILLDEVEKAHPDVFNTLLQVMDEGRMTDGNGTTVDFRNTIIIMTSNSGSRQLKEFGGGVGFHTDDEGALSATRAESIVRKALQKQFAPEFLNRLDDIIMFQPLKGDDARRIVKLEIDVLQERLTQLGLTLQLTDEAWDFLVKEGFDAQYGARSLKRAIQSYVEDPVADLMMADPSAANPQNPRKVSIVREGDTLRASFA